MRFYEQRALMFPRNGVHVQWRVEPESDDLELIEVELTRSESPAGPFTILQVLDPLKTFAFTDRTAPWRPKGMELYYKLVARLRATGEEVDCGESFGFQGPLPLDAIEIIRQHNLLLYGVNGHEPKTGIRATLYKKRNFGPRCQVCTDQATGRVIISQCRACAGTGFRNGGYYAPMIINMTFQPNPNQVQITNLGKIEDNDTVAFMTNFPVMTPGDLVIEPNESHWRVIQIDVTERKRTIVHQLLKLRQLDHNDIEYEVFRHLDNNEVSG